MLGGRKERATPYYAIVDLCIVLHICGKEGRQVIHGRQQMHGRAEKTHHRLHRLAARANDHITLDPRNTRTDTRPRSTILTRKQSRNKFFARKDTYARTRHLAGTPQTNTDGRVRGQTNLRKGNLP